mgnify:CR=1 FL=1
MANIWRFIGLPDPEDGETEIAIKEEVVIPQPIKAQESVQIPFKPISKSWIGPQTPDGEAFHDMAEVKWSTRTKLKNGIAKRAFRHIVPDKMNRLPIQHMIARLMQGDILMVDLSVMIHMDAYQRACRQSIRHLSNEYGIPVFALDDKEKILILPGKGVIVDIDKHILGVSS